MKRATVAHSPFDQFLEESTYPDPVSSSTLTQDSFYGLYTSWCCISRRPAEPEDVFWAAMKERISPGQCLRMTGPAAADYFLTSYQPIL